MAVMFGTNRQYNLERLPFSVESSFMSIYQNIVDKQLYLSVCRSEGGVHERPNLLRLAPVFEDREISFTYYCDEAKLTLETKSGTVEITYEQPDIMRIRVNGVGLRIFVTPNMHEAGAERIDGEILIGFNIIGKLLFKKISGRMVNNAKWDFINVCPFPFEIDILPSCDGGAGEAAIHELYSNGMAKDEYLPFDAAYAQTKASFEEFFSSYPPVAPAYKEMARKAAWIVWQSKLGPRGDLKKPLIYMHKLFFVRAFGWQQNFHAIAMKNNPRLAWDIMTSFFEYQNDKGGLPDGISDLGQEVWRSTKPPIFGFATCYMLDNFDLSVITREDYADWYAKLSKYYDWWFIYHDHTKTGYPAYYHVDESGYDESTIFNRGLPLHSPDLLANMVLHCEALSRLAGLLGLVAESVKWMSESRRVLRYLTDELWDGEQFRARILSTGELYKCGSIVQLQPAVLGSRLPKKILRKLSERLCDESEFLTDFGIATENLKSDKLVMKAFTRGAVVAPTQLLLLEGLREGGETEAAEIIATRYLNALQSQGLALGIHSYRVEPVSGEEIKPNNTPMSVNFPFSAWVASIFMLLASHAP